MPHMLEFMRVALDYTALGLSPVALEAGPVVLRWYSLAYIAGILFSWWYLIRMIVRGDAPYTKPQVDDFITWATLGVILGGRIAYVLFYDLPKFVADPLSIFYLWEGGMSFHGGTAGVIIAAVLYANSQKISKLRLLDYVAVTAPVGLFFGRLANFVNGELWGRVTTVSWGMTFPGAGPLPRHPSQLYEAVLEGLVLFIILSLLFWRTRARLYPGLLAGVFGIGYGAMRLIVELFREPDAQLGVLSTGLTMGQTLSLPLFIAGAWLIVTSRRRALDGAQQARAK